MEILYISSVPSKSEFEHMKKMVKPNINLVKYGMQESSYKFHSLIQKGLIFNNENIYSLIGRPVSYMAHKKLFWKKVIEKNDNITYEHVFFLNLPIIKNIIVSTSFFFKSLNWLFKNRKKDKFIIMDAAYITVIPFAILASKIIKCKKISIVCDIYEYMGNVNDAREKKSSFHKFVNIIMKSVYKNIDGFVFLTEAMNNVLNKNSKPYIVMEGLVDSDMININNDIKNKSKKDVIMYAGAIRAQYGIKNLLEAFLKYENKNAELWLYGAGDYVDDVKKISKKDHRIKYKGLLSLDKIVLEELKATILINPRSANQEFTKYSFPSKNMEYMVSGTPVLTTKLPGMPKEYYEYVYLVEGDNENDILDSLNKLFSLSKKELHVMGKKAKEFVLNYKNNIYQSKRIIELGKSVISEKNT